MENSFITWLNTQHFNKSLTESVGSTYKALHESLGEFDDNLAAKVYQTTLDIYKVTKFITRNIESYGDDLLVAMRKYFEQGKYKLPIKPFSLSEMGLSEDFVKAMPEKLYVILSEATHDEHYKPKSNKQTIAYTNVGDFAIEYLPDANKTMPIQITVLVFSNMTSTSQITERINRVLPHELRHIADSCDKSQLDMMMDGIMANINKQINQNDTTLSAYYKDPSEIYARMTEVLAVAFRNLQNPEIRKNIHSAKEVLEKFKMSAKISAAKSHHNVYNHLIEGTDDDMQKTIDNNLERVIAWAMDKLI